MGHYVVNFQIWYFCWSGHVSSSLISNVSKVTSLWYLVCICGSWRIAWVISHTLSVQLTRDPADKSPGNAGIEKDQVQFCLFFHLFYIEAHVVNGLGRKLRFILICLKDFLATWQADIDYRIVLQSPKFKVHIIFSAKFVQHELFNKYFQLEWSF